MTKDFAGQTESVVDELGFAWFEVKLQEVVVTVVEAFDSVGEALFAPVIAQGNSTALIGDELGDAVFDRVELVFAELIGNNIQQLIMDLSVRNGSFFHNLCC